jgi:hypothetical protein
MRIHHKLTQYSEKKLKEHQKHVQFIERRKFVVLICALDAYRILAGKPEGKIPLERPRCRWVENIKIGLREIGWDIMDWIDST